MKPTAAPATWPYLDHRTVADLDVIRIKYLARVAELNRVSLRRALTDSESRSLEWLLQRAA